MYIEQEDPSEKVGSIFNNISFAQERAYTYPPECGISRAYVSIISPTVFVTDYRADLLSSKFGKLRSDYGVSYSNFQKSEQHDNSAFPASANGCS